MVFSPFETMLMPGDCSWRGRAPSGRARNLAAGIARDPSADSRTLNVVTEPVPPTVYVWSDYI